MVGKYKLTLILILIVSIVISLLVIKYTEKVQQHDDWNILSAYFNGELEKDKIVLGMGSYIRKFTSVKEAFNKADLVIVGRAKDVFGFCKLYTNPQFSAYIVYTFFEVEILKVIKGTVKEGDIVIVRQLGGPSHGKIFMLAENPLFKKNEMVLLFLFNCGKIEFKQSKYYGKYEYYGKSYKGKDYYVHYEMFGRFEVINSKVYSLTKIGDYAKVNGLTLEEFIKLLKS